MTAGGLRLFQNMRRSLLGPPRQLPPRNVTASEDGDTPENVSASPNITMKPEPRPSPYTGIRTPLADAGT